MLSVDLSRSAVLVLDYQAPILAMYGNAGAAVVEPAKALLESARKALVPVIYVVMGYRPGYPELSPRNSAHALITKSGGYLDTQGGDVIDGVRPKPGDLLVVKHRVCAFTGTDLEQILRARQLETLILLGVATSGVVLSTVRCAADLDYRMVVVADGCADRDEEVHRLLLEKIFPRQARVTLASEVAASLDAHARQ